MKFRHAQSLALAACVASSANAAPDYFRPADKGGSMLASVTNLDSLGEPLNVIVSGSSDASALTPAGFLAFMQSIDLSGECLGFSEPASLLADLGDGQGSVNATATLRYNFGNPDTGTCNETIQGGNHLRYWQQTGSSANSGAYFLAVSVEQNLTQGHNIVPGGPGSNGYDLGRDQLAGNATKGTTSALGYRFSATARNVTGLLSSGSSGVNHDLSLDGIVTVLTVKTLTTPSNPSSSASAQPASPSGGQNAGSVNSIPLSAAPALLPSVRPYLVAGFLFVFALAVL